jgi:hypothetical protein
MGVAVAQVKSAHRIVGTEEQLGHEPEALSFSTRTTQYNDRTYVAEGDEIIAFLESDAPLGNWYLPRASV